MTSQNHDNNRLQTIFTWDGYAGIAKISVDSIKDTITYGKILTSSYLPQDNHVSMSDSAGVFIFGSNGIDVYDRNFNLMQNGDSLSTIGPYSHVSLYPTQDGLISGYFSSKMNAIPLPGQKDQYVFFHTTWYFDYLHRYTQALNYCRIDMADSSGIVVEKNELIQTHSTMRPVLIKHGNGIDWWLISANRWNTDMYVYLINNKGIIGPKITKTGTVPDSTFWYGLSFDHHGLSSSPDGEIISSQKRYFVDFLKFDRCNGDIHFLQKIIQNSLPKVEKRVISYAWDSTSKNYFYNIGSELYQINLYDIKLQSTFRKLGQVAAPYTISFLNNLGEKIVFGYPGFFGIPPLIGVLSKTNIPGSLSQLKSNLFYNFPAHSPNYSFGLLPIMPNYRLGKYEALDTCHEDEYFNKKIADPILFQKNGKEYHKLFRKFE